jgi:hypothetical protein
VYVEKENKRTVTKTQEPERHETTTDSVTNAEVMQMFKNINARLEGVSEQKLNTPSQSGG